MTAKNTPRSAIAARASRRPSARPFPGWDTSADEPSGPRVMPSSPHTSATLAAGNLRVGQLDGLAEDRRRREEQRHLDLENEEYQGHHVETQVEPNRGRAHRRLAAFVSSSLGHAGGLHPQQPPQQQRDQAKQKRHRRKQRQVGDNGRGRHRGNDRFPSRARNIAPEKLHILPAAARFRNIPGRRSGAPSPLSLRERVG